jgi:phage terminase large subunit-like protein
MSYEMGQAKFMGATKHWIWLDEEPPADIFTQCVTRTATTGGIVSMTFTPEQGLTPVVAGFLNDRKPGQYLIQATWYDVTERKDEDGNVIHRGHLTQESIEQLLAVYPQHEREMRTKGIPVYGSGAVFPIHLEDSIRCDAIPLPAHWPRICGLDFGWDHPTAAVWIAWDRDGDTLYVYDAYTQRQATAVVHADAIKRRGNIPVAWPKDGQQSDKGSGINLADQYREAGVNMLPEYFRNKPTNSDPKGTFAIEPGIQELYARMENGTFRVFSHLTEWWKEFRQYYRQDGKIVPMGDDLMSATRYAACSASRYAQLPSDTSYHSPAVINYKPLGPGYR